MPEPARHLSQVSAPLLESRLPPMVPGRSPGALVTRRSSLVVGAAHAALAPRPAKAARDRQGLIQSGDDRVVDLDQNRRKEEELRESVVLRRSAMSRSRHPRSWWRTASQGGAGRGSDSSPPPEENLVSAWTGCALAMTIGTAAAAAAAPPSWLKPDANMKLAMPTAQEETIYRPDCPGEEAPNRASSPLSTAHEALPPTRPPAGQFSHLAVV